ncbi:thiol-disulfide oxidoreductase DCC family protein [Halalkalibacterium ligniniphilum]|uniref:thiol-disulfide oxidoreductase DCC family protein n=1 Tax=Halalkalibacterium ligniniphilum TaxID=1134413 RepID=UPI00034594F2|nr:thiol-disulfide oxidoreductase DCC family protein [Halalkalibacterium ligniniphilum]
MESKQKGIVLFDGGCNFCDYWVQFILKHDTKQCFQFASLQSDAGMELRHQYSIKDGVDSVILIDGENVYMYSDAALKIAAKLNGSWKWLKIFKSIPRPLRDIVYKFVATNRYRFFGKKEACRLLTPDERKRFL